MFECGGGCGIFGCGGCGLLGCGSKCPDCGTDRLSSLPGGSDNPEPMNENDDDDSNDVCGFEQLNDSDFRNIEGP